MASPVGRSLTPPLGLNSGMTTTMTMTSPSTSMTSLNSPNTLVPSLHFKGNTNNSIAGNGGNGQQQQQQPVFTAGKKCTAEDIHTPLPLKGINGNQINSSISNGNCFSSVGLPFGSPRYYSQSVADNVTYSHDDFRKY